MKISLPIGVAGMAILRKKFKSVFANALAKTKTADLNDFADISKSFGTNIAGSIGNNVLNALGSPIGIKSYGSSDFTFAWTYVEPINDYKDIIPLPNQQLIQNTKGRWVLDFVTSATSLNTGINTANLPATLPISLKVSISKWKLAKKNRFRYIHDMFSKINTLSLGIIDSNSSESTAINLLFDGQSGQLLKIFQKIGHVNSNATFELQILFNDLKRIVSDKEEWNNIYSIFDEFVKACKSLNNKNIDNSDVLQGNTESGEAEISALVESNEEESTNLDMEKFKKAFDALKKIANIQHKYIFKPHYENAFFIKS